MAIQLAKLARLRVITVANSQKHGKLLKDLGAGGFLHTENQSTE